MRLSRNQEFPPVLVDWPIRRKLTAGLSLLAVTVLALFGSAYYGLYAYRELVRGLSARSAELPLASRVLEHVIDLRVTLSQATERLPFPAIDATTPEELPRRLVNDGEPAWEARLLAGQYRSQCDQLVDAVDRYRRELEDSRRDSSPQLAGQDRERGTLAKIDRLVAALRRDSLDDAWGQDWLADRSRLAPLVAAAEQLQVLATALPSHLHERLRVLAGEVRARYRMGIVIAWITLATAVTLLAASRRVFYAWFADPLHALVVGSRRVAAGDFRHRIRLSVRDEIGELAAALNAMTDRFCDVRDDLDRQVQERTNQAVRSEQLASVGFLAAGVSHEINNPLASIALCSESLEGRLEELLDGASPERADDVAVARNYLQMIQREAFRCKQITEKLLDFARRGDSQRQATDLRDLAAGVVDMVQHLGQFHNRSLELASGAPVIATVNPQEIKQVVLNLVTNGLESLDPGGVVRVEVVRSGDSARIIVADNGCGLTDEVRRHLFEPFFTRRRSGQGTGLGLSISHRIVEQHRGRIDAFSDGPGQGSRFVVTLPIAGSQEPPRTIEETRHRYQAA